MLSRSIATVIAIAALYGSSAVSAQVAGCARNYTVISGDTCDEISAKENVSSFQLASVNNATINAGCTNLFPGEVLCLGITGEDCQVTHVVASGDTCEAIAEGAGTTFEILLENNPNVDSECTNIHPGEVLCTADDVIVPQNSTSSAA